MEIYLNPSEDLEQVLPAPEARPGSALLGFPVKEMGQSDRNVTMLFV